MSSYTSRVIRDGEAKARAHMRRIGRNGGRTSTRAGMTFDEMLGDPRSRRLIRKLARENGTSLEEVQRITQNHPSAEKPQR